MTDVDLHQLVAAAERCQRTWESQGLEFCFIGGLAVQRWGEPRLTGDVDATVWTQFGNERPIIEHLLSQLQPRIDRADEFAVQNRVLLVQDIKGIDIDIALAAFPFERELINRATLQPYYEVEIKICGASDLVILKAFANRPRDWEDIRGIAIRSKSLLDWTLINQELEVLSTLKEEPEILERIQKIEKDS